MQPSFVGEMKDRLKTLVQIDGARCTGMDTIRPMTKAGMQSLPRLLSGMEREEMEPGMRRKRSGSGACVDAGKKNGDPEAAVGVMHICGVGPSLCGS